MTLKTCKLFIHLMKFSTLHPQLPHIETRDPANVLVVGQTIVEEHLRTLPPPVPVPLHPGQVHHLLHLTLA